MSSTRPTPGRTLRISLWVVQVLLALVFGFAGAMKATQPIEALAPNMPWVLAVPALVRFIGVSELLGAVGLVLPSLTRIQPKLTPIAASALLLVMVLAAGFHAVRGEWSAIIGNIVLGALAAFVAWGRFRKAPIASRAGAS